MKANVMAYVGLILLLLQVAIICNITAKSSYADSVRTSLDESLERTMSLLTEDAGLHMEKVLGSEASNLYGTVTIDNEAQLGEFKTNFIKIFAQNLNPKIDNLIINFYGADEEKGLLSVEIIADFTYLGGNKGTVSSYKTMIINKTTTE